MCYPTVVLPRWLDWISWLRWMCQHNLSWFQKGFRHGAPYTFNDKTKRLWHSSCPYVLDTGLSIRSTTKNSSQRLLQKMDTCKEQHSVRECTRASAIHLFHQWHAGLCFKSYQTICRWWKNLKRSQLSNTNHNIEYNTLRQGQPESRIPYV